MFQSMKTILENFYDVGRLQFEEADVHDHSFNVWIIDREYFLTMVSMERSAARCGFYCVQPLHEMFGEACMATMIRNKSIS